MFSISHSPKITLSFQVETFSSLFRFMSVMFRLFISWMSLLRFVLILPVGCRGSQEDVSAHEWTVSEGALVLDEDLFLSETEDFFLGSISDVAVRDQGGFTSPMGRLLTSRS